MICSSHHDSFGVSCRTKRIIVATVKSFLHRMTFHSVFSHIYIIFFKHNFIFRLNRSVSMFQYDQQGVCDYSSLSGLTS